ncbi:MAG: peptidyl-prolyl cis-trans isomerase [Alcaligenaceae bacterium]|jgi:peptidyl-prolyl cis-trans isomerase B (cyclophilin B)|nr:peptidyl-prolyl cis-trans isomerase [Alcaligenaceae bacterium]
MHLFSRASLLARSLVLLSGLAIMPVSLAAETSLSTKESTMSTLPRVKLETNHGDIVIELNTEKAPVTAENFLGYVKEGFYDNVIFHRVIKNFMIQGGGMQPGMKEKNTRDPIKNEADNGLKNDKYTIAMARTQDPHSASAQFFINSRDNDFLNFTAPTTQGWGYAVFGKVVEGTEVVDQIENVKTGNRGFHQDVPVDDVVIQKASIVE